MRRLGCLLLLLACARLGAADPLADARAALSGDDADAKKNALRALSDKTVGEDDSVYPLLIQAVGDRQASEAAIAALRSRSGLTPSAKKGAGGYPGYPPTDTPASWNTWLAARKADRDKDEKIKKALKEAEDAKKGEAKKPEDKKDGQAGDATAATAKPPEPTDAPPADLGKLDRIVFKTGGSLLCYILDKRVDDAGNLISVRVAHRDGGGEEILAADLIARIEEDIE